MTRFLFILCILSLALAGCSSSSTEESSDPNPSLPIVSATVDPTDTPFPTSTTALPTMTATVIPSETPTASPLPTDPQPTSEYHQLPSLIPGQAVTITQISMIDALIGWGIGHQTKSGDRILYTEDGGYAWEERTPPIPGAIPNEPDQIQTWGYFYDRQTAWVFYLIINQTPSIDSPVVMRTNNRGESWEVSEPLPLTGDESYFVPESFSFIDQTQGWLLVHVDAGMSHDYSNLYSTSDGGITWNRLVDPYGEGLQSLENTGLAFGNSEFGWVTKDNLAVMPGAFLEQSNNGGHNWEAIFLPAPEELDWFNEISQCATSDPIFLESTTGIVLVNCNTFDENEYFYTYQSTDQGQSWRSTQIPTPVQSLFFIDNQTGWALGRDIYQSTDGGLSWVKIRTVNWDGQFSFVDEQNGWAVASANENIALVFTQDRGNTWQMIEPTIK